MLLLNCSIREFFERIKQLFYSRNYLKNQVNKQERYSGKQKNNGNR
ncbi:MAG: hypothetical protein K0R15_540 [Clostridiales bacterium]|jgi:hypothetical protein|nr:hypothetical protein [Clostridiales bacterium]